MMRTIEVFLVIIIITGAFIIASFYAVLPIPRRVSPMNLKRLALTTLQILDADYNLSATVFKLKDDPSWVMLQVALSALLPPNIVYNLTVYDVQSGSEGTIYTLYKSLSNAESLGIQSEAASYLVASSNVTFKVIPEKVGERSGGGITLYILNCSDARGWWITGYTAHSLAEDLYKLLSPYFAKTVMVQDTEQFERILNGSSIHDETLQNAVVINTFGEAVPISDYYKAIGYDSSRGSYAKYTYILGQKVRQMNWTWISIVGYPLYYVSNSILFTGPNDHNSWGIYGMKLVGAAGLNAFLKGINGEPYEPLDTSWITLGGGGNPSALEVYMSSEARSLANRYGIYPDYSQTATRAVPSWIQSRYNLTATAYIFDPVVASNKTWIAGATFVHREADGSVRGKLVPIGLARTTDIRVAALAVLSYYQPRLHHSEFNAAGTSRLVVLQLGQVGGT